jgi:hypothetical protein
MNEIQSIAAVITSVKRAIDIAKTLGNIQKSYNEAEYKVKIVELTDTLVEAKERLVDVKKENVDLREELASMKLSLNIRSKLTRSGNTYIVQNGAIEGYGSGPFCTQCFDSEEKLVALHSKNRAIGTTGRHGKIYSSQHLECPKCHTMP